MLKKRIIPIQLLNKGRLVKSVKFSDYRDVGDPVKSASVYTDQLADELIILNTEHELGVQPLLNLTDKLSEVCFMPLTMGGGISSFDDAAALIKMGADKIFVNTLCYQQIEIVERISNYFGAQAVVAGVDIALNNATMQFELYSSGMKKEQGMQLKDHVCHLEQAGVGEILIQSIDRDGTMEGLDCALVNKVAQWVDLPILVAGGAGHYDHLKEVFATTAASGVVCGSLFNFSDSNPIRARAHLLNHGLPLKSV